MLRLYGYSVMLDGMFRLGHNDPSQVGLMSIS